MNSYLRTTGEVLGKLPECATGKKFGGTTGMELGLVLKNTLGIKNGLLFSDVIGTYAPPPH